VTPEIAKYLSEKLLTTNEKSQFYTLENHIDSEIIENFHTFANGRNSLGAFLLKRAEQVFWILVIDWKGNNNFYLVIYPEEKNSAPIAELHREKSNSEGADLVWQYTPRKKDGKNEERKLKFTTMYSTTEAIISLPSNYVTLDDTLNDLFHLARCRIKSDNLESTDSIEPLTFAEGKRLEKKHYSRERSSALVNKAKKYHSELNSGNLPCEVCGFDFKKSYGSCGEQYIEAHHRVPLSQLDENENQKSRIEDLAMVCANCHRMLHRTPWKTTEELKKSVSSIYQEN